MKKTYMMPLTEEAKMLGDMMQMAVASSMGINMNTGNVFDEYGQVE